jgi:ankyrin repeat protein
MFTNNEDRMSALHIATLEQHILLVKMLLDEFKADVDS